MKKCKSKIGILILLLVIGAGGLLSLTQDKSDNRSFEIRKNLHIFSSIFKELNLYYVDTINVKKAVRAGIDAMLAQLDPYTTYFSEEEMKDLNYMTTGNYGGIGSIVSYHPKKKAVLINEPYFNMPAAKAGLKAGDILLRVDTVDTKDLSVSQVSEHLKGDVGTPLTLRIKRPGVKDTLTFHLTREKIHIPSVPFYGMVADSVGFISLTGFTQHTAKKVKRAVVDLKTKGAKSLIIDLRNNGGGLVNEAVNIVNLFVPKATKIVSTKGKLKEWNHDYLTENVAIDTEIPLVVLVNSGSASASEILSGSLQDLDRAVIVGQRTFGKGLVQSTRSIDYDGSLKLTTSKYYIPSGRCIQAIDYTHRNKDGSVGRIPDSLTHVFHTQNGREVRDGGGILPDEIIKPERLPNILYYLVRDNLIFDYATHFCSKHKKIAKIRNFVVNDRMYDSFKKLVKTSDFKYDRQSLKILEELKKIAKFEGYEKGASKEFEALEKKLKHNLDRDLDFFSKEIKRLIAHEIVKRYYYQAGGIQEDLKKDNELDKAIEILENKEKYNAFFSIKK
jgi:carboxyl-terminal processing protease